MYPETELILNAQQKVYHLDVNGDDIADTVIVVGDQNRVSQISRYFTKINFKTQHREFVTHTGTYNGKQFTVMSTGIGTDNIDIVVNELDAAVNINLQTRENKPAQRVLNIVRLGTSGALQADIPVNGIVVSTHGLGMDGLLNFYSDCHAVNEQDIVDAFIAQCTWQSNLPTPYCISASAQLLSKFDSHYYKGITATAPGFYAPQGREIRLKPSLNNITNSLSNFLYKGLRITNFEMETAALYGLGKLLGHHCITACVIIGNRQRKEFTRNYAASEQLLIESCLNQLSN